MSQPTGVPGPDRLVLGDAVTNAVAGWVQRELNEQPWYRRKANTITTTIGTVATAVAYLGANATGLPDWAPWVIAAVGLVATVLGVNVTPNGVTPTTGAQLQRAAQDPAVVNAVAREVIDTVGNLRSMEDFRRTAEATLQDVGEAAADIIGRHRRGD